MKIKVSMNLVPSHLQGPCLGPKTGTENQDIRIIWCNCIHQAGLEIWWCQVVKLDLPTIQMQTDSSWDTIMFLHIDV